MVLQRILNKSPIIQEKIWQYHLRKITTQKMIVAEIIFKIKSSSISHFTNLFHPQLIFALVVVNIFQSRKG